MPPVTRPACLRCGVLRCGATPDQATMCHAGVAWRGEALRCAAWTCEDLRSLRCRVGPSRSALSHGGGVSPSLALPNDRSGA